MRELAHLPPEEREEGEHERIRGQPANAVITPDIVQKVPLQIPRLAKRLRRCVAGRPSLIGVGPAVDEDLDLLLAEVEDAQRGQTSGQGSLAVTHKTAGDGE